MFNIYLFRVLNMETKDKLIRLLADKNLKRSSIIKETGASKGAVSLWISGATKPNGNNLISLCNFLECDPRWLMDDNAPYPPSQVREQRAEYMSKLSAWDDSTPVDDDEIELPCFTEVEASAGDGSTFVQENHGAKIRFSRYSLRKCSVDEHNAYGIRVKGDSMQPVLPDGATIGIDVGCKRIIDGKTYAIDHGGMLRVKLLYRLPGNKIRIKSHNPEYEDEVITLDTEPDFKIIGRMFWHSALDYL